MKFFPCYTQLDKMDCGPTCLRMIAKYYGRDYSIQYLREKSFITRQGVSMLGISDAAERIGFHTNGLQVSWEELIKNVTLPCILHWNQNHFVVLYNVKKKRNGHYILSISDPAGEKYTIDKDTFLRYWISTKDKQENLGTVLVLSPTPDFYEFEDDQNTIAKRNITYYIGYLRPYRSQLIQLLIGMGLGSILQLIFPFLTQAMVDQGIGNHNLSFITLVLIAQLFLFSTQLLIDFIRNWIILHINSRISISLISDFLTKLMKLPIRFFDSKNVGDILQRIKDNGRIKTFLTGSTLNILFSAVNFIIFAIILAYYKLSILLVFLLGNSLYVAWILLFMKYRRRLDYRRFSQSSIEQSNLVQLVTGMQEIKLTNSERHHRWKWEGIQVSLFKINLKGLALGQYQQSGSLFFS